jgi:hypothetical protein
MSKDKKKQNLEEIASDTVYGPWHQMANTLYKIGQFTLAGAAVGYIQSHGNLETTRHLTEYSFMFGLAIEGGFELPKKVLGMAWNYANRRFFYNADSSSPDDEDDEPDDEPDETALDEIDHEAKHDPDIVSCAVGGAITAGFSYFILDFEIGLIETFSGFNPLQKAYSLLHQGYSLIPQLHSLSMEANPTNFDAQPLETVAIIGGAYGLLRYAAHNIPKLFKD